MRGPKEIPPDDEASADVSGADSTIVVGDALIHSLKSVCYYTTSNASDTK